VVGGGEGGTAKSMKNIGKTGFTCFTPFGRHCMKSGGGLFWRDQIFATGTIREKPPIRRLRAFQFLSTT
jgi:hypothetical protein